jgi:disulfide oxidoreductase YuzD
MHIFYYFDIFSTILLFAYGVLFSFLCFTFIGLVSGNNTSVFKYFENNTSSDYSNKSYIPSFLDTVDPAKIEEAVKLCEGLQNIQCVFDFVFTDNENVANDTKKRKNKADETDMEISNELKQLFQEIDIIVK